MIRIYKQTDKKHILQSLVPKIDITNTNINDIQDAVDNDSNFNIGIVGPYGSGKSSVIQSYAKKCNKKLLYISLAILNEKNSMETDSDISDNESNSKLEERLEKAIVNQIIHQIDPASIPQSLLKSKKAKNYFLHVGFIFIGALLLLLNIPQSYECIINTMSNDEFINYSNLLSVIKANKIYVLIATIIYFLYLLYYLLKKFNFSSIIKLKSDLYELEANTNNHENNNDSYFDRYLDDIIYCISQSKCDAIVFEDIDRFNNQEIFIKLKEINHLLNNRHKFGKVILCKKINEYFTKKIPFIYAMNDDLFKSSDKTKFFDVVIPVLPYINGDNSAEKFNDFFGNNKEIKPDSVVLSILSHYITDMRLLKNIFNEYIIYIRTLSNKHFKQHDYNQLFSLIVYKNLYPTDFSNLQYSKGDLYKVIHSRATIIKEYEQRLIDEINKLEDEINKIDNEFIQNKHELDILYSYVTRSNQYYPMNPLVYSLKDNFFPLVNTYDNNYVYRLKLIEDKNNNKLSMLRKLLNEKNTQLQLIQIEKLSNLIVNVDDINKLFNHYEIEEGQLQLIRTLLVNNFINEDYKRYLSHFHNGNASVVDINFIKSVNAREIPKFEVELDNIEWILSKINPETLHNNYSILNYSLLYYILFNNKEDKLYFQILDLIGKYQGKYLFIIYFYTYCLDKELVTHKDLLNDLYVFNPQLIKDIFLGNIPITEEGCAVIYYYIIKNSDNMNIDNIYYDEDENIKNSISKYVSRNHAILQNTYIIKDSNWNYLKNFNIKFKNLNYIDNENLENGRLDNFLNYIVEEDLYEINQDNINYLVDNYLRLKANNDIKVKSNYEIYLNSLSGKPNMLKEYIVFLNKNQDDIKLTYSTDIEYLIINNEEVDKDDIITFLEKYKIIITDICKIRDDLWHDLLEKSLINHVWENIIVYYNKYQNDKTQKSSAEVHIKEFLLENQMENKLDTNKYQALFNLIIKDEIEHDKFLNIIQTFEQCNKIPLDITININNMQQLLQNNIFIPTKENFDICHKKYHTICHYFIQNNISLYIENINSHIIGMEQLEYITNLSNVDVDDLFRIINYYFTNNSYASYRNITINNKKLLEKIFRSELDKNIKISVFKNSIDIIIKTKNLLLNSLSLILDSSIYDKIIMLNKDKSTVLDLVQFNESNDILNLLVDRNILVKKEHSQYIELFASDDALKLLQKK